MLVIYHMELSLILSFDIIKNSLLGGIAKKIDGCNRFAARVGLLWVSKVLKKSKNCLHCSKPRQTMP